MLSHSPSHLLPAGTSIQSLTPGVAHRCRRDRLVLQVVHKIGEQQCSSLLEMISSQLLPAQKEIAWHPGENVGFPRAQEMKTVPSPTFPRRFI